MTTETSPQYVPTNFAVKLTGLSRVTLWNATRGPGAMLSPPVYVSPKVRLWSVAELLLYRDWRRSVNDLRHQPSEEKVNV